MPLVSVGPDVSSEVYMFYTIVDGAIQYTPHTVQNMVQKGRYIKNYWYISMSAKARS